MVCKSMFCSHAVSRLLDGVPKSGTCRGRLCSWLMVRLARSSPISASSSCRLRSLASCEKLLCSGCCNAQAGRHPLSLPASDRRAVWQDGWQHFAQHRSFLFCSIAAHSDLCHSPRIRQIVSLEARSEQQGSGSLSMRSEILKACLHTAYKLL